MIDFVRDLAQLSIIPSLYFRGKLYSSFCKQMRYVYAFLFDTQGNSKPPIIVTEEDVNSALSNTTPMSMQGVQLYKSDGHSWSNVGGLTSTKNALAEILQWPLKYPEFFKNAPIKLQSGVLLYGMPGTGKTMLAKAIAGECGVNLISIKVTLKKRFIFLLRLFLITTGQLNFQN